MGNPMTLKSPRAQERLREIKELVRHESLTRRELQAKTDIGIKVLRNYLVYLQENNEIYIEYFHKVGKVYAPCFRLGDKPSVHSRLDTNNLRPVPGEVCPPPSKMRKDEWVPRCDWAASWVPIRRRDEEVQA